VGAHRTSLSLNGATARGMSGRLPRPSGSFHVSDARTRGCRLAGRHGGADGAARLSRTAPNHPRLGAGAPTRTRRRTARTRSHAAAGPTAASGAVALVARVDCPHAGRHARARRWQRRARRRWHHPGRPTASRVPRSPACQRSAHGLRRRPRAAAGGGVRAAADHAAPARAGGGGRAGRAAVVDQVDPEDGG